MPRSSSPILPAPPDETVPPYEERDTIPSPPPPSSGVVVESRRIDSGIRDTLRTPLVPGGLVVDADEGPATDRAPAPVEQAG
jgi:hypothetical protein